MNKLAGFTAGVTGMGKEAQENDLPGNPDGSSYFWSNRARRRLDDKTPLTPLQRAALHTQSFPGVEPLTRGSWGATLGGLGGGLAGTAIGGGAEKLVAKYPGPSLPINYRTLKPTARILHNIKNMGLGAAGALNKHPVKTLAIPAALLATLGAVLGVRTGRQVSRQARNALELDDRTRVRKAMLG